MIIFFQWSVIGNISGYDTRRIDLIFGIGYASSISKAYEVIQLSTYLKKQKPK